MFARLSPVSAAVDDLANVMEGLTALDPAALADGESLVELLRQAERLEAAITRAAAVFDAGRGLGGRRCPVGGGVAGYAWSSADR